MEARYLAFLETISALRPSLHRYCSRMTGSVLDGEDVVQDALFQAYRKLETYDSERPLKPWLFRIAHNQCIDLLRRREARARAEATASPVLCTEPAEFAAPAVTQAVEHMVIGLPPKERACVLLKDVFEYSLEETADLVDSTVSGVKAALSRARAKLACMNEPIALAKRQPVEVRQLLQLYAERFNRRDWDGLRDLISADAQLRVADRFNGPLRDAPYFSRYEQMSGWRIAVGEVNGAASLINLRMREGEGEWTPVSAIDVEIVNGRIARVVDFLHCPWVLQGAHVSFAALEA